MTNEFFVTGLILVSLIVGAALVPASTLLRPDRQEQMWIGLISGFAAVIVTVLHYRGHAGGPSLVHSGILVSASFLFGPLTGAVSAVFPLFAQVLHVGGDSLLEGVAPTAVLWCIGSLMWLARRSGRISFWVLLAGLVVLVPLAAYPWNILEPVRNGALANPLERIPWRYVIGVSVLCASAGLLFSRARALQMLSLRERELVEALKASGGGRWEWDARLQQFSFQGSFYADFGLTDGFEGDKPSSLSLRRSRKRLAILRSCIDPQDLLRLQPQLSQVIEGAAVRLHIQFRMRDVRGQWRWLVARGSAVEQAPHGRTLRMSGMLLDITEHHLMEEAARLSEVKYTSFYQTLPDPAGIVCLDNGRYMDVNPAFSRLLEMPASDIVGKIPGEFGLAVDPADRSRYMQALDEDEYLNGMPMVVSHRGRQIPGLLSARRTQIAGEMCMVFVFHDMTQTRAIQDSLRASNQLLQQASRLARLGYWEGVPDKGLTYWSDVTCEIHGVPVGTPAPGNYIERFVAPEWQPRVKALCRIGSHSDIFWDMEFEIIRTDGRRVWVRARNEALFEDEKLVNVRGVVQDIDKLRRTSERMQAYEARLEHIFQMLPLPLSFIDQETGGFVDVNPAWEQMLGYSRDECLGHSLVDLNIYAAQTREQLVREARMAGQLVGHENELRTRAGKVLTVLQSMSPIEIEGRACWLLSVLDITERKRQERMVREREELLSLTISAAAIGLWDWNLQTGKVRGDARWHAMQGRAAPREGVERDLPWQEHMSEEQIQLTEKALKLHLMNTAAPFDCIWHITRPKAPTRWLRNVGKVVSFDADGKPLRMLGVAIDVTLQHEQQELLHRMAHYDALTGLPNRVMLVRVLREAIENAGRKIHAHLALAYLDLDSLKAINDQLGHSIGDQLLVLVAARLQRALRPTDCVARLSGDEFAVLLNDLTGRESCERRLRALMEAVGVPYDLNGERVEVTASVGYTLFPEDSADTDTLLRHADQAMYVAKQAGGNRLRAFDSVQETARQNLIELRSQFDTAMNNGELSLYLQPKVNMRTGTVVGAEALVRWVHPRRGVLLPGAFLHAIDGTDMLSRFSEWVMESALAQIVALRHHGLNIQLSINIDAEQLRHHGFADWVLANLEKYPTVRPSQLDLEITENAALYDMNYVARELTQLRDIGVSVSLDDFGTGYSSLAYLRRLPIDQLKLDQSYVLGMMQDPTDQAIVQGVIGLAQSFGYRIVAEGVETTEQGLLLMRMGCLVAQGHGVSAPMPAEHFAVWVAQWRAPRSWMDSARNLPDTAPLV
ncbi:EAL domain-containing protein [Diaphorobacter ruginosibacter]|uniref:sensor domain-containing protein n=1 Tax=Diaphorobacter ruginosibacter TaxID=1715720 RepID=UPI00333F527E